MRYFLLQLLCLILIACNGSDNDNPVQEEDIVASEYEVLEDIYVKDESFKVVGYLPTYRFPKADQIAYEKLTYLNFIKARTNAKGELIFDKEDEMDAVIEMAKSKNPDLKIMMSLGSANLDAVDLGYWMKYLKKENRSTLINNIIDFVKQHNLDGIDVDLEGNILPQILSDYGPFVLYLKNELHGIGKAITVALPGTRNHGISTSIVNEFDFVNLMTYGRGRQQSMDFANEAILYWTQTIKISYKKIVLGVPFFGWTTGTTQSSYTFGNSVTENIYNAYEDHLSVANHNSIPTIVEKTLLAKEKLNGIMIWELGQDSFNELSLLSTIDQVLSSNCPDGLHTYFKDADGDGFGDIHKPYQACEAPQYYVNNYDDCNDEDPLIGKCN